MFVIYIILCLMRLEYFYIPIAHGRPKWSHWSWPTKGSGGRCRLPSSSSTHLHLHPDSWTSGQGKGRAPGEARMEAPGCPGITRYDTKRPPQSEDTVRRCIPAAFPQGQKVWLWPGPSATLELSCQPESLAWGVSGPEALHSEARPRSGLSHCAAQTRPSWSLHTVFTTR